MEIFNNLKKQNELLLEKVNIYDIKINQLLESQGTKSNDKLQQQNKNKLSQQVLLSERSYNDIRLLKFDDLLKNEGNDKSLESLNILTNEIEKQVTELKESDFDHKLKTSFDNYEKTIRSLNETNQDLNIR